MGNASSEIRLDGADLRGAGRSDSPALQQEEEDPVREMLVAWEHGLSNDGLQEWSCRCDLHL